MRLSFLESPKARGVNVMSLRDPPPGGCTVRILDYCYYSTRPIVIRLRITVVAMAMSCFCCAIVFVNEEPFVFLCTIDLRNDTLNIPDND